VLYTYTPPPPPPPNTTIQARYLGSTKTPMPRLDESTQQTLRDAELGIRRTTASAWESFSNFALRDNVLEVAVGLM